MQSPPDLSMSHCSHPKYPVNRYKDYLSTVTMTTRQPLQGLPFNRYMYSLCLSLGFYFFHWPWCITPIWPATISWRFFLQILACLPYVLSCLETYSRSHSGTATFYFYFWNIISINNFYQNSLYLNYFLYGAHFQCGDPRSGFTAGVRRRVFLTHNKKIRKSLTLSARNALVTGQAPALVNSGLIPKSDRNNFSVFKIWTLKYCKFGWVL